MNTLELLATPVSPAMIQIINNPPAAPLATSPSGEVGVARQSPYTNPDGSLNGLGVGLVALSTASGAASAYHGYKRNQSVGWALWWGFWGGVFPVIVPTIAVAQGFGEKEKK